MGRKCSDETRSKYHELCRKPRRDRRKGIEQNIRYYFMLYRVGSVPKWVFDHITPDCNLDEAFSRVMAAVKVWRQSTKGEKLAPVDVRPASMELRFKEDNEADREDPSAYRETLSRLLDSDMTGTLQALADLLSERGMMISYFKKIDII